MKDLNLENSKIAAIPVGKITKLSIELDIPYLEQCLKDMKDNHSFRDSAAILNPNPLLHNSRQDLEAAKIKHLELMIELGKNSQKIIQSEHNLVNAKSTQEELKNLFGGF